MIKPPVNIIGAGLAGCEAAWQLLRRGVPVRLYDIKPHRTTPAHSSPLFAELVCSNSFRSDRIQNASGLLKEEMRCFDSLIINAADRTRVPAGSALAVDRKRFANDITQLLMSHPLMTFISDEVTDIPQEPAIIATGPLTTDAMSRAITAYTNKAQLSFYDAAAPIVSADSIDMGIAFRASRYGRGNDYINCPMTEEQYDRFYQALLHAETAPVHAFEEEKIFEACMPVESLAKRGRMTLAYGPMKPVGLMDPKTGRRPFAVVQLRHEDTPCTLYNLVGFQTRLKFSEQKRVFSLIPGLENVEFVRYGVMHRNTFLNSPGFLDRQFRVIGTKALFFAGQITGVEGYVESAASGMICGLTLAAVLFGRKIPDFPPTTSLGALGRYVSAPNHDFQPMNINFGIMDTGSVKARSRGERYLEVANKALAAVRIIRDSHETE